MLQQAMKTDEYLQMFDNHFDKTGKQLMEDFTVTCYYVPPMTKIGNCLFRSNAMHGMRVVTSKDFYAGLPDIEITR